ncbi:MAG: potassium-transporting ATPase subunit C [Thermoguttaceae bacterium]
MIAHLRANLWMLVLTVLLCSVLYPLALLGVGQTLFHDKAQGSLLADAQGHPIGSRLIAQPFTADEYFQPRPSAASYNAAASAASNLSGNNYLLRDRVARQLGPIVKYASGPKTGQPVAPDIESWFQKDQLDGKPGIVAQWASLHSGVAGPWLHDWVKADKLNAAYVAAWEAANPDDVAKWKSDNNNPDPKPEDLAAGVAGAFFASFSKDHPGALPGVAEYEKDGKTAKRIGAVKEGSDIQSLFFDLWLQEHPDADLEHIPADMVTTSGSGLDPHITLENAIWQLDNRVAAAWAKKTGATNEKKLHDQIEQLLRDTSRAPLGGLVGVPLVNVLEVNLALRDRYQTSAEGGK